MGRFNLVGISTTSEVDVRLRNSAVVRGRRPLLDKSPEMSYYVLISCRSNRLLMIIITGFERYVKTYLGVTLRK
jgi:hypothetical protein